MAAKSLEKIDSGILRQLREASDLHFNHYGDQRLDFACLSARGLIQRLVSLEGPNAGQIYDVLDASGGYASACLGAGHPLVEKIFHETYMSCGYVTDELGSQERGRFLLEFFGKAGHWVDRFPTGQYWVSGRSSGSEGMELALRLVLENNWDSRNLSLRTGREKRRKILAFEGAWHGWTAGTQSLLNRRHYRMGLPDALREGKYGIEVQFLPFGETAILNEFFSSHGNELAAVIVEPIQGDAGIIVPPPGYLRRLADLCRQHSVLLVADEVLTFAKTGQFFSMTDEEGCIPTDITVIGKSIGFGVEAVSLVIARCELTVRATGAVATRDLRPLTCGLIRGGLNHIIGEKLLEKSQKQGFELRTKLDVIVKEFPDVFREVRGMGYLNGIELTEQGSARVPQLRRRLIENGVFVEFMAGAGRRSNGLGYVFPAMRIAPPLTATPDDLDQIVAALRVGVKVFREELS